MFAIQFDSTEAEEVQDLATGSIVLGSYRESFECPLHVWRRRDYEQHWYKAAHRLLDGSKSTALITELYDPASANFIKWWPAYVLDGEVRFQNQLLLMADLSEPFELSDIFRHIPPYEQTTENGDPVSEWPVSLAELQAFLGEHPQWKA